MVATLAEAYAPIFGDYARWLFLIGAIAVLYSTFFVGVAGQARVCADALSVFGFYPASDDNSRRRSVFVLTIVLPPLSLAAFLSGANPVELVLLSGVTQSIMLPMLAVAALWFRYRGTDHRLRPGRVWDSLLWLSFLGLLLAGVGTAFLQIEGLLF